MALETQLTEMASSTGTISPEIDEAGEPEIDVNINIREDDVLIFETESGRHLLRTPEMAENVYVEPVPTKNGFTPEVVVNPAGTLTETATAEPADQPEVETGPQEINIRMD
jgi:hypothetical protein